MDNEVPDVLKPYLPENANFYSCDYWRNLWAKSGCAAITACEEMARLTQAWDDWFACDNEYVAGDRTIMVAESGQYFNVVKLVANRRG